MNIEELDLSRLAKRLVSEDGLRDEQFAHHAIDEYKKFFFMLAESKENQSDVYLPSPIVDLVWQRHMLDTLNYFNDCDKFDIPNRYCHRHELRSPTGPIDLLPSSEEKQEVMLESSSSQDHYCFTVNCYTEMYGSKPPLDVWPAHFDDKDLLEKRKVGEHKFLSYAIPHASIPNASYPVVDIADYQCPGEETLMQELMWVGELVYDTLPLKQLKCVKGEVIGLISFEAQREAAVKKVVREYARFLLLIMRRAQQLLLVEAEGGEIGKDAEHEITPSKLVDELWHAHILCSPAYFDFCDKLAPLGRYVHHFPHFDKPHDYHVPGFNATLALYKEVYEADPAGAVWGVLGESGGGCGGGGCGGGGCGGGGCGGGCGDGGGGGGCGASAGCSGGGGCGTGASSSRRRHRIPIDYSNSFAGAGCGTGSYIASCGTGNYTFAKKTDIPLKVAVDLTENAARKMICQIGILNACLYKDNLPADAPVSNYVTRSPYNPTYMKRYLLKRPVEKPVEFMSPQYVSQQLFDHWQTLIERKMEMCYFAAQAVSQLPADIIKDKYSIEWKKSVKAALDSALLEISSTAMPMGFRVLLCFPRTLSGGVIYIESTNSGRKWSPPRSYNSHPLLTPLPPNGSFMWNPQDISPANAHVFDKQWVCAALSGTAASLPMVAKKLLVPTATTPSATSVPLLTLPFFAQYQNIQGTSPTLPIINTQYSTVINYTEKFFLKAAKTSPVPFMNSDYVSADLFAYLQNRFQALLMERKVVAKVVSMLQSPYLKPTLEIHMAIATETLLQKLIVDLNSDYLACFGLRLRIGNITISDRFVVLESINTRVWDPSKLPPRNFSSVGVVPTVEVERMEWAMMQLVGGNTVPANLSLPPANPAPYNQSPVQSNFYHATPPVAYPGTSIVSMTPAPAAGSNYAMPQVAYSNPSTVSAPAGSYYGPPPATYAAQWSNSVAPVHQNEMVSVTVPANYPHCGSELMTASPSSGKLFKFTIPPGSLPGSQLLISIPRI